MFDRRSTPCPTEVFLVLYLRISIARVFPLRSFNLPSDHIPWDSATPKLQCCKWQLQHAKVKTWTVLILYSEGTSNAQTVLQQVQICWISTATAHCTNGLCLSHTASFTVPCVVRYSANCLKPTPLSPQFFHFKKIGAEAKILSSGSTNRVPHRRLVVILDAGSKTRYQILKLCMNVSTVNWVHLKILECKCKSKRVRMFDMKIIQWLLRVYMFVCVCVGMYV